VNPCSSADRESESESFERELFARRARALEPGAIPSLASVLRAAEAKRESSAAWGARGRAAVAMTLAAACMMAALSKLPLAEERGTIVAEIDASAPPPVRALARGAETTSADVCTMTDEVLASEESACFAPAQLFTPAPLYTATPCAHECSAEESCATGSP
jgi:hypothetical protein